MGEPTTRRGLWLLTHSLAFARSCGLSKSQTLPSVSEQARSMDTPGPKPIFCAIGSTLGGEYTSQMHRVGRSSGPSSNRDPTYISSTRLASSVFCLFGSDCDGVSSGIGATRGRTFRCPWRFSPRLPLGLALLDDGAVVLDEDDGSCVGRWVEGGCADVGSPKFSPSLSTWVVDSGSRTSGEEESASGLEKSLPGRVGSPWSVARPSWTSRRVALSAAFCTRR